MKKPVVIIGMGEMGGVFARGLLKRGHPVYPVTRNMDMARAAEAVPDPELVLVAVGENDLYGVMEDLPEVWRSRLGFLQNELLPRDWLAHGFEHPTVVAVWFEKKKGQDTRVLIPSPIYGPAAPLLAEALEILDLPAQVLKSALQLEFELVRKNLYILTTNIVGMELASGADVTTLWNEHNALAREVADEILAIQAYLTGREQDPEKLIAGMVAGIEGDPTHKCMGRSAPARLERALHFANQAHIKVPRLRAIHARHGRPRG